MRRGGGLLQVKTLSLLFGTGRVESNALKHYDHQTQIGKVAISTRLVTVMLLHFNRMTSSISGDWSAQ